MGARKVVDFLLLRSVMTKKNFSSIGLVALFFGVYVLFGGKVVWVPKVDRTGGFGAAENDSLGGAVPSSASTTPRDGGRAVAGSNKRDAASGEKPSTGIEEIRRARLAEKPVLSEEHGKAKSAADAEWDRIEERLKKLRAEKSEAKDEAKSEESNGADAGSEEVEVRP
jgi:hypothetical protein